MNSTPHRRKMRAREEKESVETRSRCSRGAPISCKQGELAGGNCVHSLNKCVSQSRLVPKESSTPLQGDFKVPVFHKFIVGNHRVQRGDPILQGFRGELQSRSPCRSRLRKVVVSRSPLLQQKNTRTPPPAFRHTTPPPYLVSELLLPKRNAIQLETNLLLLCKS